MDRTQAMALSGLNSYYIQRNITGGDSGLQYQQNIGNNSIASALLVEPTSTIPPYSNAPDNMGSGEPPVRRKRGRPRKYGPDGSSGSLALIPSSSNSPAKLPTTQKRGRGRPPGTGQKQRLASFGGWFSDTAGMGFTPHVITIAEGEDIATKVMSISQQGPRAICILAANGSVSTVTLRQPTTNGSSGTVTYKGHFEILSLSGSYLVANEGGANGRSGGLSISLATPDGSVIGGGVGGMLIASSPVQVIAGSFLCSKAKNKEGENEGEEDQTVKNGSTQPTNTHQTRMFSQTDTWPISRSVDIQNQHADIDLMRRI